MRIVYYYRHLNDPIGSGSHATSLVREWKKAGNEVGCLPNPLEVGGLPDGSPSPAARLLAAVPSGVRHRLRFLQDSLRSTREAPRLLNDVRSWRPDVFIARHSDFDRTLDKLLDGVGCPIVAEVNAVVHREWRHLLGEEQPASAVERELAFLRRVDFSICVSAEVRHELLALGVDPERCAVVPNGADCEMFKPEVAWDDGLRAWLGARSGPLVAYCGSAGMVHDMDTLLRATERLAERVPDSLFLFVGPVGAQVGELLQRAPRLANRVHVTGVVPHEKVPSFLAAADLLWAAYRNEYGSPLKAFEYMAMGKPGVAAGVGQARHLLEASRSGTAVGLGRPEELADAAAGILFLPADARRALGSSARRWAVENGSWSVTAATMLSLIREKVLQAHA